MEQNRFEIEAKRMRPALLRMAIRYLEDSDEAEDAVQDVLLKLWFLRDRLDQYRSVDALAIVITKHLCINRLRGIRIEKVDLEQGISIGGGENPEMKLVEEENMQEILEVIGTLPDLQQSILRMKHLEGFEVEEIARLTGSTPVAVRTNLSRATPMFAWYEGGMQGEPGMLQPDGQKEVAGGKKSEKVPVVGKESFYQRIPIAVWSAGIAAMMVIALGLGFIFYSENQADGSGEWSCYEGSYVEVGGKRISDVKQIMPCIIETLEKAERVEKLAQERVEEIHRSEKEIEEKELLVSE